MPPALILFPGKPPPDDLISGQFWLEQCGQTMEGAALPCSGPQGWKRPEYAAMEYARYLINKPRKGRAMNDSQPANDPRWPHLAGFMEGDRHILPVRVYFEDTDFSGLVYHGSYLRWCERGRSDRLRLLGVSHQQLFAGHNGERPLAFVVRRMEMDFRRPARIDDVLQVITSNREWGGASITLDQRIERDGVLLMKAKVQVVLIDDRGKPQRLPRHLIKTFRLE